MFNTKEFLSLLDTIKISKMKNKIQEVQEYFRRKIVSGKYEVTEHGQYSWELKIDDHQFNIWTGNGFEYITIKGFMVIPLTEEDQEAIWKRVIEFKEDNLKLIIKRKEEEIEELKNKLS